VRNLNDLVVMGQKWCAKRHPHGITLNPPEYLLDNDGNVMLFDEKAHVENFLRGHGVIPATVIIEKYN
jgi:hypothetical protein